MGFYDSDAETQVIFEETDITGSASSKAAILMAGVTPTNTASFFKTSETGELKITGSVILGEQPIEVTGSFSAEVDTINSITNPVTVTGSVILEEQPIEITGSVGIVESVPLTIGTFLPTASIRIAATDVIQEVTGTVGITSIASPVNIGNFPAVQTITGSVILGEQPIIITGSVTVNNPGSGGGGGTVDQGNAGTQNEGWFVKITDGIEVIGTGSSAPLHITGSLRVDSISTPTVVSQVIDIVRIGDVSRNGINSFLSNSIRRLEGRSSITSPDGLLDVDVFTSNSINRIENRSSITSPDGLLDVDVFTSNSINRIENRSSITSPDGLLDVTVVTDNSINRLETRNTIVGQTENSGSEQKVTTIQDTQNNDEIRLQTESRLAPGSTVNIGTSVPSNPTDLVLDFLRDGTSSEDMLVNGSSTAVSFSFGPPGGEIWSLQDVLIVFTADDFSFDGSSFGPNSALSNGIKLDLLLDSVETTLFTINQNEDFLRVPGRLPLVNNTGPKDVLGATFAFGGLVKLDGDLGDKVMIVINDNLTSVKLKYLTATGYATKD